MNRLVGLPRIAPEKQAQRAALLVSLNGVHVAGVTLRASVLPRVSRAVCWFRCAEGLHIAIERWSGEAACFLPRDSAVAADWLERAEPLIAATEAALGLEFEPADLVIEREPADCLVLSIEGLADGTVVHRLFLAIPHERGVQANPAPFAPELLGNVAVEVDLVIEGPRLPPHEAADLARGDLVLLGGGRLRAALHMRSRAPAQGHFDPRNLCFQSLPDDRSMS